ncbi:MAG: hypothetical protein EBS09_11105 [Flavobacteriia bacterium]|nr:hypothetical protein [Flavobacteriia bacterium]
MKEEANAQKNTLLKTATNQPTTKVFKRVFFSPTQEEIQIIFSPTLRCFNFISIRTVRNMTDSASNVNHFLDSVCKLDTTHLRTDRRATDNKGFKKLAVQWLNEHLCFVSSVVLADSFVLRNRQLLKPPKR